MMLDVHDGPLNKQSEPAYNAFMRLCVRVHGWVINNKLFYACKEL